MKLYKIVFGDTALIESHKGIDDFVQMTNQKQFSTLRYAVAKFIEDSLIDEFQGFGARIVAYGDSIAVIVPRAKADEAAEKFRRALTKIERDIMLAKYEELE